MDSRLGIIVVLIAVVSAKTTVEMKRRSAIVASLLIPEKKNGVRPLLGICVPNSLKVWKQKKGITEQKTEEENCQEEILFAQQISSSSSAAFNGPVDKYWDDLDKIVQQDKLLSHFPKGKRPSGFSNLFHIVKKDFAKKYLLNVTSEDLQARIDFFRDHELVNEKLLYHAVIQTILLRNDMSNDVPNPLEVDDVFFSKIVKDDDSKSFGEDFDLRIPRGFYDLSSNVEPLSNDREERKLYYYREDPMYHAFHHLLHSLQQTQPREWEQFWYAHQQMMRRYAVERLMLGVRPVVPISMRSFQGSLGRGYSVGWYGWPRLSGRRESCRISYRDRRRLQNLYNNARNLMRGASFEAFGRSLNDFHGRGHVIIGNRCPTSFGREGVMTHTETSARDPIFYRWHSFMENLVQEYRDTRLPQYRLEDFTLSSGIEVVSVNTEMERSILSTNTEIKNVLITHWETVVINHDEDTPIRYRRHSHKDFKYQIQIRNTRRTRRKVTIRLWLGILRNRNDISSYITQNMIEMDQFTVALSGQRSEVIERNSRDSAATMKRTGKTIEDLMAEINGGQDGGETDTWCGFPHHILVPRSKDYDPEDENLGGQDFVLFAFVTNADSNVRAGSDGVEHMICGHKDISTKLDGKHFGFPFDRGLDFTLRNTSNFVAATTVKIIFSPVDKLREIGRRLTTSASCEDKQRGCPRYTWACRIRRFEAYMRRNCAKSCNFC